MAQDKQELDFYRLFSNGIAAFLGEWGLGGVFIFKPAEGWVYHRTNSRAWDDAHQAVFRNQRAEKLQLEDLHNLGIAFPDIEKLTAGKQEPLKWNDNFTREVPLGEIRQDLLEKLRKHLSKSSEISLILCEDRYESILGDGRFLYLKEAFLDANCAERRFQALKATEIKPKEDTVYLGNSHHLKKIAVEILDEAGLLRSDLDIASYEHYDLDEILRKLG